MSFLANFISHLNFAFIVLILLIQNLKFLHFLQVKNFRIDRTVCLFKDEKGFLKFFNIFSPLIFIFCALASIYILDSLVATIIFGISVVNSKLIGLFRPRFTPKVLVISFLLIAIHTLLFMQEPFISFIFSIPVVLFLISMLIPLNFFLKELYILRAKAKIKRMPNLKVIGITGSLGKSSTKTFLDHILKSHFKVLTTPKNINTEIGIAKMILRDLKPHHQILLLEIGTYKKGEIKTVLQMSPLDVAVLTAITNQHLSLFGSLANLSQAKLEIFSNLKPTAAKFCNTDFIPAKVSQQLTSDKSMTSFSKQAKRFQLVSSLPNLKIQIDDHRYKADIFAPQLQANLSLAVLVALHLKMTPLQIQTGLDLLTANAMPVQIKPGKTTFINDTYNATTDGVETMLDVLADHYSSSKKLFIFSGFLELAAQTQNYHDQILKKALSKFDTVLLTKPIQFSLNSKKLLLITEPQKQVKFLKQNLNHYQLVYFSGRQYQMVQDLIDNYEA